MTRPPQSRRAGSGRAQRRVEHAALGEARQRAGPVRHAVLGGVVRLAEGDAEVLAEEGGVVAEAAASRAARPASRGTRRGPSPARPSGRQSATTQT